MLALDPVLRQGGLQAGKGCLGTGYTSLALKHLMRAKMVSIPGQAPVVLGGRGATPVAATG